MKLEFTEKALLDLENTRDYITHKLSNPVAAEKLVTEVLIGCQKLKEFPYLGKSLPALDGYHPIHRTMVVRTQIVIYKVVEDTIHISRILDSRTDYLKVLFRDEQ